MREREAQGGILDRDQVSVKVPADPDEQHADEADPHGDIHRRLSFNLKRSLLLRERLLFGLNYWVTRTSNGLITGTSPRWIPGTGAPLNSIMLPGLRTSKVAG